MPSKLPDHGPSPTAKRSKLGCGDCPSAPLRRPEPNACVNVTLDELNSQAEELGPTTDRAVSVRIAVVGATALFSIELADARS